MSKEVVQIQYEQTAQVAQRFGRLKQTVEQLQTTIRNTGQQLNDRWKGDASVAFAKELNDEIFPTFNRLINAFQTAQQVTLEIQKIFSQAEEEAAGLFKGSLLGNAEGGKGGGSWLDSVGGFFSSVGNGVKDFFVGAGKELKDMVVGVWNMVTNPVETVKGIWHAVTHPSEFWEAFKAPYVEAWENGRPWEAIGRGTMFIGSILIGTKGADKVGKAAKLSKAATVTDAAADIARVSTPLQAAGDIGALAKGGSAETAMARYIANQSSHVGTGTALTDRVVLGAFKADPASGFLGYIGEANAHGGRYFSTTAEVWDALKPIAEGGNNRIWPVNREFLQSQLESGISRIDIKGSSIDDILTKRPQSYSAMEVRFMQSQAYQYGYRQIGDSWIKTGDWRASTSGRVAGGSIGPGGEVLQTSQFLND
ncbi:WXG100 family type VII secretion target [Herpetosiphon sp. NSE202]|uniref:WXG100 family type VII secretion target n=1 Tax=Herpetosiphon sp. NSE202 TaxID=3351349 RepID=UPI00362E2CDE